ncbi:rhodanese-like domain-containing protein [Lysobacter korlensis]|uniref:Rhodanese-like domain-containing protein n=1 Tax=Lysobacter korlensis TaxID=553636 RepID=A0ABV6RQ24_9GAMM
MAGEVPAVLAQEAIDAAAAGGYLLDVREPREWDEVHAPSATLIPMRALSERAGALPEDGHILVICHSGARSAAVTEALVAAGYPAVNVTGGMVAWEAVGGPVVRTGRAGPRP